MPSLRVLAVVVLIGMGATAAAVGGLAESGESGTTVRGSLLGARPSASPSAAAGPGESTVGTKSASSAVDLDVRAENEKPGTPGWRISRARGTSPGLAGYAGALSVLPGRPVPLSVSGDGPVRVRALRIGWYGGVGARQVWQGTLRARPETGDPASWPARGFADTTGWPEGHYLLRLDQGDASRFVPLTVRTADDRDRVVVLTSPLTWQAENTSGVAQGTPAATRTADLPEVPFARPYPGGYGSGGFLQHDAGLVQQAERTGTRLGYATDLDLATDPGLVSAAAAVLTGGDSRFWTASLRAAIRRAGAAGTNLAFFGAGTGSRQVRLVDEGRALQISLAGPSASVLLTGQRPSCPAGSGSGGGSGSDAGAGVAAEGWAVGDAGWWAYRGTGLRTGDVLPGLVAGPVDRAATSAAATSVAGSPAPLQVLSSTETACESTTGSSSTVTQSTAYQVRPSGAAVFAAGTARWACALADPCSDAAGRTVRLDERTRQAVSRITRNLIVSFARAGAGKRHPAQDNTADFTALR